MRPSALWLRFRLLASRPIGRHAAALAALALSTSLQLLVRDRIAAVPFLGTLLAVAFAAWFCGTGPGILVLVIGAFTSASLFLSPQRPLSVFGAAQLLALLGYAAVAASFIAFGRIARSSLKAASLARTEAARERALLREAIEQLPAAIGILGGPDHVVEHANAAYRELARTGDVVGRPVRELFPASKDVNLRLDEVRDTGQPWVARAVEYVLPGSEGRFFDTVQAPLVTTGSSEVRIITFSYEVTELVRARLAQGELSSELAVRERDFRMLANSIPQLVWTIGPDGILDYANDRWRELSGQDPMALRGTGYVEHTHPDDLAQVRAKWFEARRTGTKYETEFRFRLADGSYRWFLARALPVKDASGAVLRWFGTSTDIDAQRRAADRDKFLSEASSRLSSSLDYEATLLSVSRAAVPHFADWASVDLAEPDGSLKRVAVAHVDPAKVEYAWELWRKYPPQPDAPTGVPNVLRTGRSELVQQIPDELLVKLIPDPELLRIVRALKLESVLTVPVVARGRTLGAISFVMAESKRIYTEQDQLVAEELGRRAGVAIDNARLYREAQEASRLKDEFLSTLSHELRTPLTAVLGWTHFLTRPGQPADKEKIERAARVIERNARAQAQLIEDMLDVSRIVTGKMRLAVRQCNPHEVIEAALETVKPAAEVKGVRISAVLDPLAGPINGDPDRLQQVAWNLLSNAIKFTPKGGRVQARLARINSHIELEVSDAGEGIDPAFLPFVFDRFRQADGSATRPHGGLGLGLAITKHLVELHGGTVEARSEGLGHGASFVVKLPLSPLRAGALLPAQPALHPAAGDARAGTEAPPPGLAGLGVLIVDDSADTREMVAAVLADAGARVRSAGSAGEALLALSEEKFDLLISDIGMPERDGYSLIAEVRRSDRARGARMPAVALTAYARAEDRTKALLAGFDVHVPKPIEPSELVVVVAALVRRVQSGP